MGQEEILTALQNLGGAAIGTEIMKEYVKLHYPIQQYDQEFIEQSKITDPYFTWRYIAGSLAAAKKNGLVGCRKVQVYCSTEGNGKGKGAKQVKTEYYLL